MRIVRSTYITEAYRVCIGAWAQIKNQVQRSVGRFAAIALLFLVFYLCPLAYLHTLQASVIHACFVLCIIAGLSVASIGIWLCWNLWVLTLEVIALGYTCYLMGAITGEWPTWHNISANIKNDRPEVPLA